MSSKISLLDHWTVAFILVTATWLLLLFANVGVLAVYEGPWSPLGVYAFAVFVWLQAVGLSFGASVLLTWAKKRDND